MSNLPWDIAAERETLAYAFRTSYWAFLQWGFGVRANPKGTWFEPSRDYPLARFLQLYGTKWLRHRKCGRSMKLMIIEPRDTAKTVKITKAFQIWLHLQDVNLSTAMGSADRGRAEAFLLAIKAVLDGTDDASLFARVFGNWRHPLRPWREDALVHGRRQFTAVSEPSFGTFSVETGATAYHPDVAIIDDPITIQLLNETGTWLKKVNAFMLSMIPVVRKDGLTIYVGTPYEEGDAITTLLRDEGVASVHGMKIPFEYKEGGEWHVFYMSARDEAGVPLFPKVWSESAMLDYERRSPMDYAAQVMCNPIAGQNRPISKELLAGLWVDRAHVPKNLVYTIHMDTAFKHVTRIGTGDDNAIVLAGHAQDGSGDVYYEEARYSNSWQVGDVLDELAKMILALRNRKPRPTISRLTDERPTGKPGLWPLQVKGFLANLNLPCPPFLEIDRQKGPSKANRLRDVAGYWVDGRVKLVRGGKGLEKLAAQMLTLGKPHDDLADAAADAFNDQIYYPMVYSGDDPERQRWPSRPYDDMLQGSAEYFDPLSEGSYAREPIR